MPSKLGGMLASGRPIVAGAHADTQVASAVAGAGLVVPPDDGDAMADAVAELAAAPGRRAAFGRTARDRAVASWNRETILRQMESLLKG